MVLLLCMAGSAEEIGTKDTPSTTSESLPAVESPNSAADSVLTGTALDRHLFPPNAPTDVSNVLSLVFNGYRRAMIEPCGCISYKLGGVDKEARLPARLDELGIPAVKTDAGGFTQEVSREHALMQTRYQLSVLRLMKLQAVNVGFHDLGFGVSFLRDAQTSYGLPLLSCNITDSTSSPLFVPYRLVRVTLKSREEIVVGVLGATRPRVRPTPEAPSTSITAGAEYNILDPRSAIRQYLPEVRRQSDIIVLLMYDTRDGTRQLLDDLGSENGICVAVVGETLGQVSVPSQVGRTWLVSGGFEGRQVGHMMLQFQRHQLHSVSAQMIDVLQTLPPVQPFTRIINEYQRKVPREADPER